MKRISIEEFENKFVSIDGDLYDLGMLETDNSFKILSKEIYKISGDEKEYMKLEVRLFETFENDGYQAVRFQDVTIDGFFTDSMDQLINESDSTIMSELNIYDIYQYSDFNYENWKTLYTIDSQDNETRLYKSDSTVEFDQDIENRINNMTGYYLGLYEIVSVKNLRTEESRNDIYYVADLKKHIKCWNGMKWVELINTSTFIVKKIGDVYVFDNRDEEGICKLYGAITFDSNCNIIERLPWSWERHFRKMEQLKSIYL